MGVPKQSTLPGGQILHYSIGAVIERDGKYVLLDRLKEPFGFACPAGHVDEREINWRAMDREVYEETGLEVLLYSHVIKNRKVYDNKCRHGVSIHEWDVYLCQVKGTLKHNPQESKSIGTYSRQQITTLKLEPIWRDFLKELEIIE